MSSGDGGAERSAPTEKLRIDEYWEDRILGSKHSVINHNLYSVSE